MIYTWKLKNLHLNHSIQEFGIKVNSLCCNQIFTSFHSRLSCKNSPTSGWCGKFSLHGWIVSPQKSLNLRHQIDQFESRLCRCITKSLRCIYFLCLETSLQYYYPIKKWYKHIMETLKRSQWILQYALQWQDFPAGRHQLPKGGVPTYYFTKLQLKTT